MRIMLPTKDQWIENGSISHALELPTKKSYLISVVGGGGKSTTVEKIAWEYKAMGEALLVSTTTHMYQPKVWPWCKEANHEEIIELSKKESVIWFGQETENGKMKSFATDFVEGLAQSNLPMIVEADGSKHHPCKIPSEKEPVILATTNLVIGIMGMTALNKPWNEVCFRYQIGEGIFYEKVNNEYPNIAADDLVRIIESNVGLRKGVESHMRYVVILNQVDNSELLDQCFYIREKLSTHGIHEVYLTSHGMTG